ncbi:MAG: hypothetical protein HY298_05765 [Verrucomicrobia bacterium]|nr:hypothetical protein [Verrucomicrobiota bacterium]
MALLALFPMEISVNDQEDKNENTSKTEHDNDRLVVPHFAHKLEEVQIHGFSTYTISSETKIAVALELYWGLGRLPRLGYFYKSISGATAILVRCHLDGSLRINSTRSIESGDGCRAGIILFLNLYSPAADASRPLRPPAAAKRDHGVGLVADQQTQRRDRLDSVKPTRQSDQLMSP